MTGARTTRDELLAPFARWTWLAKFWLCEGIRRGTISFAEAKEAHSLTYDELTGWYLIYSEKGANGLRWPRRRAA